MAPAKKMTLIVSPDKEPKVKLKVNTSVEVVEVAVKNTDLEDEKLVLATLCGYETTYCVALVEL